MNKKTKGTFLVVLGCVLIFIPFFLAAEYINWIIYYTLFGIVGVGTELLVLGFIDLSRSKKELKQNSLIQH